jgi:secreted trypsin-like serine protease
MYLLLCQTSDATHNLKIQLIYKLFTGSSVCNGDSGSGMVFAENQRDGTQIWKLRGIVSNSKPNDDNKKLCDTTSYIVFTDIAQYLDWISSLII